MWHRYTWWFVSRQFIFHKSLVRIDIFQQPYTVSPCRFEYPHVVRKHVRHLQHWVCIRVRKMSVSVHSVGVRYLVVTQKNGCIRTLHNFANRIGMVCNQSKSNLPFSKTISVPTKEVRNNVDRNPGLRSPRGAPPPLDMALWHTDTSPSQCVCVNYAWIAWNWWKKQQYILPVESHGKGSLVDRSLHCVLENLGVDGGTGGVEHLDLSAQYLARWIRT